MILLERASFSFRDLKKRKKQISEKDIGNESDKVEGVCILELVHTPTMQGLLENLRLLV